MGPVTSQRYGALVMFEFVNKSDDIASQRDTQTGSEDDEQDEDVLLLKSEQVTLYNPTGLLINQAMTKHYDSERGDGHSGAYGDDDEDAEDSDSDDEDAEDSDSDDEDEDD